MDLDPQAIQTVGALINLLTQFKVAFSKKFCTKSWDQDAKNNNRKAAWDLYVEMETRITTQPLDPEHGDEKTALDSVYSLFQTTREILLKHGPDCTVFAKIAIEILNQKVRPFIAKWHRKSLAEDFGDPAACQEFRTELETLQDLLRAYMQTLAVIAGVEE